jgi:hypothetical protein
MQTDPLTQPANSKAASDSSSVDFMTLLAVALVVYTASSIFHEGIGHGLARVLLGGKIGTIASTVCIPAGGELGQSADRLIAAAGTVVNLLTAALCWRLLLSARNLSVWTHYFLWLLMTVNGFMGAGYLAVPTLIGFGDWMIVLRGLHPYWLLRAGFILVGVALYGAVAYLAVRTLEPFLSRDATLRRRRVLSLALVPYVAGGLAFCAAGLFNPVGMRLVIISAAASSFGGASGLVWLPFWTLGRGPDGSTPEQPVVLPKRAWWIALGITAGVMLIVILGRGIKFSS